MYKCTVNFATVVKNGVIHKVGKSVEVFPPTKFNNKGIMWYEDKPKKADK